MSLNCYLTATLLASAIAWMSPLKADTLVLAPTDGSTIRVSNNNQGTSEILFVGDTATSNDFLRSVLAFDLNQPLLAGATITNATLTLTVRNRDSSSASLLQTIHLHPLSASFTNNGVTWTSRDGSNNWLTPGGDFGSIIASVSANAGTLNTGNTVEFSSTALTTEIVSALGGPVYLIAKLATEDANRSVFSFASQRHTNQSYHPRLTIEYQPDPDLNQDINAGDPDLDFGTLIGEAPFSAARTLRFVNDGPTRPIAIESVAISGSSVFSLDDIRVNGSSGQSLPLTLEVGDTLALTVSAYSSDYLPLAEATLTLDTDNDSQDRIFEASVSFLEPGSAVPHPAVPGKPASAAYQLRVDGIPVPVNDESYFDFHTAFFSIGSPAMVEIEFSPGVSYRSIHPLRHGIQPTIEGNTIRFPMLEPHKLVVKANGALPLVLCATPLEENIPSPDDPDVLYFGPGTHEPGVIEAVPGQTIYLASGALVKGRIRAFNADNVTIRGRGTLDADGYSVRGQSNMAIRVERSDNVHVSGIGIRGGTNWMTLFLLSNDCSISHVSLLGKTVNTDGIDIDGVQRFVARNCFIRCEDDGFGWHAISALTYGELPTRDCLAEDCVIWNTSYGNGLRIGASMETQLFENITFRNIDVLEHANAAIHSDHSDWAICRNIRFENFTDETTKLTVDIFIDRTRYSGSRDERGHYDGLHFINLNSPGGGIRLAGYDAEHLIENVTFTNSYIGGSPVDQPGDITTNAFVSNVSFAVAPPTLRIDDFQRPASQPDWIRVAFPSVPGVGYSIQASSDLGTSDPFINLLQVPGTGVVGEVLFHDPDAATAPRRFYRVAED